ncbi:sulfatase [Flavisolibacter ginsenosidimutans]|nr:sulfatase [Flavisolibacter ginsenosidimutans]
MKAFLVASCLVFSFITPAQKTRQPNVLIILADDLGWADLTSYGSTFYETPNLDNLASQGIRFTQAYATCPVCSPSRASLMTGKYTVKTGVTDWIKGRQADGKAMPYEKLIAKPTAYQLALEEKTIAEVAADNHYQTFFAGKWHLGEYEKYWPDHQGFQVNTGGWSSGSPTGKINDTTGGYFTPYANPKIKDGPPGEYITDRLADECINFIDKNGGRPFLMEYALYAVHNPLQAPAALIKKYEAKKKQLAVQNQDRFAKDEPWMQFENGWKRRLVQDNSVYAAMIENMDWNIGRILRKLKDKGIDDNTLIIFTSDNGGLSTAEGSPTVNGPLRAGKGWLYEGGIRVPAILYWKGKIVPATVSDLPITTADFYPTIAKAINERFQKDKAIDGENILALLADSNAAKKRDLCWHYPHYSNQGGKPGSAIRSGNYKLIYNYEDSTSELYDVVKDISEKNNLASSEKKIAERLKEKLMKWLHDTHALFPDKNPNYKPTSKVLAKGQDE